MLFNDLFLRGLFLVYFLVVIFEWSSSKVRCGNSLKVVNDITVLCMQNPRVSHGLLVLPIISS